MKSGLLKPLLPLLMAYIHYSKCYCNGNTLKFSYVYVYTSIHTHRGRQLFIEAVSIKSVNLYEVCDWVVAAAPSSPSYSARILHGGTVWLLFHAEHVPCYTGLLPPFAILDRDHL